MLSKQYDRAPVKCWEDWEWTDFQAVFFFLKFWRFSEAPWCRNIVRKSGNGSFATAFID